MLTTEKNNWLGNVLVAFGERLDQVLGTRADFVTRFPGTIDDAVQAGFGISGYAAHMHGGIGVFYDYADAAVLRAAGCGLMTESEVFVQTTLAIRTMGRTSLQEDLYHLDGFTGELVTTALSQPGFSWPSFATDGGTYRVQAIAPQGWFNIENVINYTGRILLHRVQIRRTA